MKKVLSIVLSIIMALTAFLPITALAGENTFSQYVNSSGKKGGEIYGAYEGVRLNVSKYNLQGYDEVISLVNQSEAKFSAAEKAQKDAYFAHVEVEKDKVEAAGINAEASEDFSTGIIEGFGSAIGDPSACARDCDVIVSDCAAAKADAETAIELYNNAISGNYTAPDTAESLVNKSSKTAGRAFLEYCDAEKTYNKIYLMFKDSWDYVLAKNKPLLELRERAVKLKEKADSDVQKNHECIEKAKEEITAARNLAASAYEKAIILCNNATDKDKDACERVNDYLKDLAGYDNEGKPNGNLDFVIEQMDKIEPAVFDVDVGGTLVSSDRLSGYDLFELRKTLPSILLSKWYLTANELTYNGKEQPLVTLGKNIVVPEDAEFSKVKFALGSKPDDKLDEVVYYSSVGKSYTPDDSKFTEKLPTAKAPGTYYVYAKFPDGLEMVAKVVIKSAPATKKDNTLFAKGKTVKLKASKLKKKGRNVKRKKVITVNSAVGTVTYSKAKGNKKISVDKKTGNIKIKKGLKKGKYKVTINVTAAGNNQYKSVTKPVTVKIIVK